MDSGWASRVIVTDFEVRLCHIDELVDGYAKGFDPYGTGSDVLFVVRRGASLHAYRNRCPHQRVSMPWKKGAYLNASRTRIVCSAHGAHFDIESGRCVLGAALGQSLTPETLTISSTGDVFWHRRSA